MKCEIPSPQSLTSSPFHNNPNITKSQILPHAFDTAIRASYINAHSKHGAQNGYFATRSPNPTC